jgi:hypothetical protein
MELVGVLVVVWACVDVFVDCVGYCGVALFDLAVAVVAECDEVVCCVCSTVFACVYVVCCEAVGAGAVDALVVISVEDAAA